MLAIVRFDNVSKLYTSGDHILRALDKVSFTLDEGKFVVILGPSGAGKSTLLNLLGGLDSPSEGTFTVSGADISKLGDNDLADYRASTVGFVFQFYNLIPTLTVYENVKLVSEISKDALAAEGYITVDEKYRIALTESGDRIAQDMIERHRVIFDFLIRAGVEPSIAKTDACEMEHVISPQSLLALKDLICKL